MKIPIVKGHNYTNITRDLGGSNGTLYQVLDTTANTALLSSKSLLCYIDKKIGGDIG
jgi:hypothetical protein